MTLLFLASLVSCAALSFNACNDWVVYEGKSGPGHGKSIVFLSGDEEYRSEEGLPALARILAYRHGFKCTVLFSLNSKREIDPTTANNEPGLAALDSADVSIMLLRFREWPDEQMSHFVNYYLAGKSFIALRTSTHAFAYTEDSRSPYRKYGWNSKEWLGGFGRQVLGETWVSHWGDHGQQATRGIIEPAAAKSPILRGVSDIFGDTDVYEADPPVDAEVLVRGQVLAGMDPSSPPASNRKKTACGAEQGVNYPMMPVAWIRHHTNSAGKTNKVFTTTMGSATDLKSEGLRRLLVNAVYWGAGLEAKTPTLANVDLVGAYQPSSFGFGGFKKGVKPVDLQK